MPDRELLEAAALAAVDARDYYELADYIEVEDDETLWAIVNGADDQPDDRGE